MAGDADAALELSILDVDVPISKSKSKSPSWWKPNVHYAVAWLDLDPLAKQSTGTLTRPCHRKLLYFPLSSSILHSLLPSALIIDLLSPSRFPFHSSGKLLGTAVLSLSSVRLSQETFTLPLLRPSGKSVGSIRVFARVLWDLGFRKMEEKSCASAPSIDLLSDALESSVSEVPMGSESEFLPEAESVQCGCPSTCGSEEVIENAPESSVSEVPMGSESESLPEAESVQCGCPSTCGSEEVIENEDMEVADGCEGGGDKGRVAMGLIGAFAAIAVGVACHRLKVLMESRTIVHHCGV